MKPRAQELIRLLQLQPHPEGGWFAEVFRSDASVQPKDDRGLRSALTCIYFLLEAHQFSQWHRVRSDEVWVHLEGDALKLWCWDGHSQNATFKTLGPVEAQGAQRPQQTIAAGHWQAARPAAQGVLSSKGYTLVACMVAPGFDFVDFCLLGKEMPEFVFLNQICL